METFESPCRADFWYKPILDFGQSQDKTCSNKQRIRLKTYDYT